MQWTNIGSKLSPKELTNEMICNVWYSVREFHIHLSGVRADGEVLFLVSRMAFPVGAGGARGIGTLVVSQMV